MLLMFPSLLDMIFSQTWQPAILWCFMMNWSHALDRLFPSAMITSVSNSSVWRHFFKIELIGSAAHDSDGTDNSSQSFPCCGMRTTPHRFSQASQFIIFSGPRDVPSSIQSTPTRHCLWSLSCPCLRLPATRVQPINSKTQIIASVSWQVLEGIFPKQINVGPSAPPRS